MAISTSGIEQRLADLKIVAATTNIKRESLVDRLKQIPEVLSTVIEDLKMKNPVVDRKIQEECNKCCNPMREDKKVFEDYEVKSEDIEVTREDKEDDLTYLNRGTKYNNMGSSENNVCDVKLEVQGKLNVPDMQAAISPIVKRISGSNTFGFRVIKPDNNQKRRLCENLVQNKNKQEE
ncbi:hypothetical protein NDU88_007059 [Pleurodeles waltl]|uniref:Uncharacterized protein n=1 Tax=Pleurodeles waltl TaxID=8319 RepID=A0AAV7VSP9_PLEWA|nr:hypothetical protein NDU88_007059 [Pleurodeles waltl]